MRFNQIAVGALVSLGFFFLASNDGYALRVEENRCQKNGIYEWSLRLRDSRDRFRVLDFASLLSCQETLALVLARDFQGEICNCDPSFNAAQTPGSDGTNANDSMRMQLRCSQVDERGLMNQAEAVPDFERSFRSRELLQVAAECDGARRLRSQPNAHPNWSCAGWLNDYFLDRSSRGDFYFNSQGELKLNSTNSRWTLSSSGTGQRLEMRSPLREVTYAVSFDANRNLQSVTKTIVSDPGMPNLRQSITEAAYFTNNNNSCLPSRLVQNDKNILEADQCRTAYEQSRSLGTACEPFRSFITDDSLWRKSKEPNTAPQASPAEKIKSGA